MKYIITTILAMGFLGVFLIYKNIQYEKEHPCLVEHEEERYSPPFTTFIPVGKVMVPQDHPGYWYTEIVCDVRK